MDRVSDDIFVSYFSPWSPHMVEFSGMVYPTAEHAYHAQRYAHQPDVQEKIRRAKSPFEAWQVSQLYKNSQLPDFNERKVLVMEAILREKLTQHTDVQKALVESGDKQIVKHITTGPKSDGFWDDGEDGQGRNEVGKIWMKLRDEFVGI